MGVMAKANGGAFAKLSESKVRIPDSWQKAFETPMQYGRYVFGGSLGRSGPYNLHRAERLYGTDFANFEAQRLAPAHAEDPRYLETFWTEARAAAALGHPNVVGFVDFGSQDGEFVLVRERGNGVALSEILRTAARRQARLPLRAALFVALEVLAALDHAHGTPCITAPSGVVHGGVCPSAILVGVPDGRVRIGGFAAQTTDTESAPSSGRDAADANLGYRSPERITGGIVDHRSDIFSVGVLLFELLTGKPLFSGRNDFETMARACQADIRALGDPSHMPLELRLILATALTRNPRERYRSAADFSDALGEFARHLRVTLDAKALASWLAMLEVPPTRSGTYARVDAR